MRKVRVVLWGLGAMGSRMAAPAGLVSMADLPTPSLLPQDFIGWDVRGKERSNV
jgi:hypothetical protein